MSLKVSILGTESAGKTVFLATLAHSLSMETRYPRIKHADKPTKNYTLSIMEQLEIGEWPASTAAGVRKDLRWIWHDSAQTPHNLHTYDCAGQTFRDIFESENEDELDLPQLELKQAIFESDLILLLFNLGPAIEIANVLGKNRARLDAAFAPACALRKFRAAGITTYILFSQADSYADALKNRWQNDLDRALSEVLPHLHIAIQETGCLAQIVNAIQTEKRADTDDPQKREKLFPVVSCYKAGAHDNIIGHIDNFLIQNRRGDAALEAVRNSRTEKIRQAIERKKTATKFPSASAADTSASATTSTAKPQTPQRPPPPRLSNSRHGTYTIALSDKVSLELLPVASGSFQMGNDNSYAFAVEKPVHKVTLSQPFWLGKTAVTQAQWEAVMGNNPSRFKNRGANRPVENISWEDAVAFCKKLTERERATNRLPAGCEYVLPTEAEWEYVCRAGSTSDYAGTGKLEDMGWFDKNSGGETHDVATKRPNAWGFFDMHGNVWEWCSDWYGSYPSSNVTDPQGAKTGDDSVNRGGSWSNQARFCRAAFRYWGMPSRCGSNLGFRLALKSVRSPASPASQ
ncbi:MAG: formylglycine-generating enzyme family protein [Puniceicoccales bacterium]|jgi:formylglycine-generating enzyme required for sulfatase activity|nr:formylglycine-generating enzyme family protein [Puniceicoccales bacterium]